MNALKNRPIVISPSAELPVIGMKGEEDKKTQEAPSTVHSLPPAASAMKQAILEETSQNTCSQSTRLFS